MEPKFGLRPERGWPKIPGAECDRRSMWEPQMGLGRGIQSSMPWEGPLQLLAEVNKVECRTLWGPS